MSIHEVPVSGFLNTRNNYPTWHRNDFFSELFREATGVGANTGACGDVVLGKANFQTSATISQVHQSVVGTQAPASKLQGVQVSNTQPVNGDVLTFDSSINEWTPEPSQGNISGTGVASEVAYFSGPSTITGSLNFLWDNTNKLLFVGSLDELGTSSLGASSAGHGRLLFSSVSNTFQTSENTAAFRDVMAAGPTSNTATSGADTLPANPAGFVTVKISGTDVKIPFYNP